MAAAAAPPEPQALPAPGNATLDLELVQVEPQRYSQRLVKATTVRGRIAEGRFTGLDSEGRLVIRRKVKHIYVGNWFFGGFILTVAMLHVVNNLELPVTFTKSYSLYAGATDAMVQWWYGHNAVGFFLTAGFLGMMYYFVPKQGCDRSPG